VNARLLHTADWQLGKPFGNVPGDAGAILREARFEAVRRIAGLASLHQVDAVLVAGDVFDSNLASEATLSRALAAMRGFAGPWLLLPGNHDAALAASAWTRLQALGLPANVMPLLEPRPVPLADGRIFVLPAPLTERRSLDDLTAWMDEVPTPAGALRIGLAHGSVTGRLPAASEAPNPIDPERAARARLDHLALGDWHGCLEIAPRTWYAGTPEPDRHRANEAGTALLVELGEPGAPPAVRRLPVGRHRWQTLALDCTGEGDVEALEGLLAGIHEPELAVARLELRGVLGIAGREMLESLIARRRGECLHLEVDDSGLALAPADTDLQVLDADPALGRVARALRERGRTDDPLERAAAELALRLLWREGRAGDAAS
jgi:DNA repair exonuclease SbcCD nuclease subunit